MPSEEPLGAKPGEHTSGVGALPGKSTETGVAVLPEEKGQHIEIRIYGITLRLIFCSCAQVSTVARKPRITPW